LPKLFYIVNKKYLLYEFCAIELNVKSPFSHLNLQYAKKGSSKSNTFGWARAEVLGANVNAVFLVALCFTILVEAIQRMVELEPITNSKLLLIVGGVGLGINLIGLALFHNQGN